MTNNATIELLERLRAYFGARGCPATDYRVAKELKVTRSTVSKWRTGDTHMSNENILKAMELAELGWEGFVYTWRISAERDSGKEREVARGVVDDLDALGRGESPREDGLLAYMLGKARHAAAILLALGMVALPQPSHATAAAVQAFDRSIHYANWRGRLRRHRRRRRPSVMPLTA